MKKRAFLIELNLALSLVGICTLNTEKSSLTAILLFFLYFSASVCLYIYASRKGWIEELASQR
jgi:hypothetical protein